jgi:hypothetical protein
MGIAEDHRRLGINYVQFGGIYRPFLQGKRVGEARDQQNQSES